MPGAVALSNCGGALHLAMLALGVEPGDEVIVADYTFPAPAHAVRYVGATPVFADVRADTGTVDPQAVADLITPRTVGVIAVDTVGMPADYTELKQLTDRYGLFLIEDAACAVGATYQGRQAGSLAPVACLSFHGRKGVSSGEGGALLTADPQLAADARLRSSFGIAEHLRPGAGRRPADLGVHRDRLQLQAVRHRRRDPAGAAGPDRRAAGPAAGLRGALRRAVRRRRARHGAARAGGPHPRLAVLPGQRWTRRWTARAVAAELRAQGIGCGHGTWACHLQPVYETKQQCPVSADLFERQLGIPMHAELSMSQVERVATALRTAVRTHARVPR